MSTALKMRLVVSSDLVISLGALGQAGADAGEEAFEEAHKFATDLSAVLTVKTS